MHDVEELAIPSSVHEPDAIDFIASVHVQNACEQYGYGIDELSFTAAERLPSWHLQHDERRVLFGIRVDGTIVARVVYETLASDAAVAWASLTVLPEFARRGFGTALMDHVEALANSEGRTRMLAYGVSPASEGDVRLPSPTGFGSLPLHNSDVQFALGRGYTLEQVERGSRLALPVDIAVPDAPGYRVHTWTGPTPPPWRADLAHLYTRMSTDAPSAGLEEPEDPWTVERLIAHDQVGATSPRDLLTAVVEHVDSGNLVGYTQLSAPAERDRAISQEDTLVLREHRGHRLGTVLKLANLAALQEARPGHPSVLTFNAEENRPMLDVNEAVGFVPIGYEGAWKKPL